MGVINDRHRHQTGKGYALVIGIVEYDDDRLTDLNSATRTQTQ